MTLYYELIFFDYWHLSSGLSAGAKLDSSVVKDENNLPYAPGKTIKGLVREMAEEFGEIEFLHQLYFSNAFLKEETQKQILDHKLENNLYDVIASTQIDKDGVAIDNSLREIEVVVPLTLYGEINDIEESSVLKLKKSLSLIKRMGLNRNRGLGRCEFIVGEVK